MNHGDLIKSTILKNNSKVRKTIKYIAKSHHEIIPLSVEESKELS